MDDKYGLSGLMKRGVKLKDLVGKIDMGKTNHRMIDEAVNGWDS